MAWRCDETKLQLFRDLQHLKAFVATFTAMTVPGRLYDAAA
jgi:hypothetical protein